MSSEKITKENLYIHYNSLISISTISEEYSNKYSNYLIRVENIEQTLLMKKCKIPLSEFTDLKESLFYIREIGESKSSSFSNDKKINSNNDEDDEDRMINYNQEFFLQHMVSKKFICLEKLSGSKNYNLKLTSDINSAIPFVLKRIHETRTSQEFLTFKQSVYLSIYIKEKGQFFYVNTIDKKQKDEKDDVDSENFADENFIDNHNILNNNNIINNNSNNNNEDDSYKNNYEIFWENYPEISIGKKMNTKYYFINQSWYINHLDKLFSSQIINIIFITSNTYKDSTKNSEIGKKEEQFMLGAEYIDNINEDEIIDSNEMPEDNEIKEKNDATIYDENKGIINLRFGGKKNKLNQQIKIKAIPYEKDFYKHVINNCFWVIEEEDEGTNYRERLEKTPLKSGSQIIIKNILLGLYLQVKIKDGNKNEENINNNNSSSENNEINEIEENPNNNNNKSNSIYNDEDKDYEFELVDEKNLINNCFFRSNFRIFHYDMNEKDEKVEYMDFKGKFAFRTISKESFDEKIDICDLDKYFQSLSINIDEGRNHTIKLKNEDDFIFEIKKVDILEANHVIYIQKLIQNLNTFLLKCKNKEIAMNMQGQIKVILFNISFFLNYLLNIEYIFRDDNFDINLPIEERKVILENYGILKCIRNIAEYLIPFIQKINQNKEHLYQLKKGNFSKNNIYDTNSVVSSYMNNNNFSYHNMNYHFETINEQFNSSNGITIGLQRIAKVMLDFLTCLSTDNEEIKEKIFIDLDIILELAEKLFLLDRSIMLNFIFKLLYNSEVLQEYVTGGKLNLLARIKNSKGYKDYAEKESNNKLIRMDRILLYIETSQNYLYYYKKLLNLNKVKHKKEQIKKLIIDHMLKVEREYITKYNYKRNLINVIQRIKLILDRIEKPLIENAINKDKSEDKQIEELEKMNNDIEYKLSSDKQKEDFSKIKNNSEEGLFLNEISDNNDEKKIKNFNDKNASQNKNKKISKEEEKKDDASNKNKKSAFNIFKSIFGIGEGSKKSKKIEKKKENKIVKTNYREKIEKNLKNLKMFLSFFEKFNLNNTLFLDENISTDIFDTLNVAKNSKSKLDYLVNGKNKNVQIIDGLKLDPNSELGQFIPYHLFNKFFPKFKNMKDKISYGGGYNMSSNIVIDEDSEDDLYNNEDYNIQEGSDTFEENNIINTNVNNINQLPPKQNMNGRYNDTIRKSISHQISNDAIMSKKITNVYSNKNIKNKNIKYSYTNPLLKNNNLNIDENLMAEFGQKQIDQDLTKLNKYLCNLYVIYQFCINQYIDALYNLLKVINNYFLNYELFCDMNIFEKSLNKIKENLLSRIIFINNDVLENLYSSATKKPTLLKGVFDYDKMSEFSKGVGKDLDNFGQEEELGNQIGMDKDNGGNKIETKKKKIKEFTTEEITLIKSLFYFCRKYDKIEYIKDKVKYYRAIKGFMNEGLHYANNNLDIERMNKIQDFLNHINNTELNLNEKNDFYISEFLNILDYLHTKRNEILDAYIDVHNCKEKLITSLKNKKDTNSKSVTSIGYNINKRFNLIIKLLLKYELENIFGKLIYLDMNRHSSFFGTNILKNLKYVTGTFKELENEIRKIRIDYDRRGDNALKIIRDQNNNNINTINLDNSHFNKEHFELMNNCLSKMSKHFLNFLNINANNLVVHKNMPKLNQILIKENENFYKKIGFIKIMENLIETIDYYYDFYNNPKIKLKYCEEILRIFMDIQGVYKNFKENIPEYFELYYDMIMRSLHTISLYNMEKVGSEEEKAFLNICYYSCESFLIIILNSKKDFGELRTFMIDILQKLIKIYSKLKEPKNRVLFQILYTYYISRILIFIGQEKYYDDFSYNSFFQIVYPMEKMHDQILSGIEEILKGTEDDKTEEEEEKSDESEEKEEEEMLTSEEVKSDEEEEKKNNKGKKRRRTKVIENDNIINTNTVKDPTSKNNYNYYHNNKFYNNFIKKMSTLNEKNKTINTIDNKNTIPEDSNYEILWDNEDEKDKFTFYLNFLSIYVLYLHDKNSIRKFRKDANDEKIEDIVEYDFKSLYSKIQKLLDNSVINSKELIELEKMEKGANNVPNKLSNKIKNDMNNLKLSILNANKNKINKVKNNYQFESVLLESIILFKYREKEQNVEIAVKNRERNKKINNNQNIEDPDYSDASSNISEKVIKLRNNDLISFYYYDNEYIDLIFLEKICNDIHISENINYYCTGKVYENNNSNYEDLLEKLLSMQKEYKLITSYYKGEYNLLHDQYINNDMEEFILLLKTRFTTNDFNSINAMKKFLYKRMNEIYSEDLYNNDNYNIKKTLSFVEQFKAIERLKYLQKPEYNDQFLYSHLLSLVYLYPNYPKKTCYLYYKIGFQLLIDKYTKLPEKENNNLNSLSLGQNNNLRESLSIPKHGPRTTEEKESEFDKIIEGLQSIFSRKVNQEIIQNDEVFFSMINSLIVFLKEIKQNHIYLMKNISSIRKLLTILDFIFDHLINDFEKIVNFMKSAENQKLKDKYRENEIKLKIIIIFISTFLSLKKSGFDNLLTKNIIELIQNLSGQVIKLILILIEIGKEDNMKTADMLIDFIYFFIEGPDIDNLNSLFAYRFFNLITFLITKIDYFKIFVNNINRTNLHNIMDSYAKIEKKIFNIFFVYYNVTYNNHKNTKEYIRLREWYEKNYLQIKEKLKKLYHFSNVEMEKRQFDIDDALLFIKKDDSYTEEELFQRGGIISKEETNRISLEEKLNNILSIGNELGTNEDTSNVVKNGDKNKDSKSENENDEKNIISNNDMDLITNDKSYNTNKSNYCLIKFDLLLAYYTLHVYYNDIINEEYFEVVYPNDTICENFLLFIKQLLIFLRDVLLSIYDLIVYLYRRMKEKAKAKVELLQELNDIDTDIQNIDEKEMILDLSSKIKCVEVTINQILYKVYFPIIDKAKKIENNTDYYLQVGNDDLPNYISYIIRNYDNIHISVTKNYYFDKLAEIPIFNLVFKNIKWLGILIMILGIVTNLLILLSYSDFTNDADCDCDDGDCDEDKRRLYCPRFLFNENNGYTKVKRALHFLGLIQLILQFLVIFDYVSRNFSIKWAMSKNNLILEKAKKTHGKSGINITKCEYIKVAIKTGWSLITFQLIYYFFYIVFTLLGRIKHPFFYCFSLLELVNRVEVMLSVLKAMYVPGRYLLINLIMFIMLEYVFSLFALTVYPSHFPNIKDSENFLQTFMRMLDQTFKKDGGIGTYLDKSLDPDYVPYTPKAYAGGRFWFDLIFYLMILLIIFQILTSIIIDYFMNTRKNREDFEKKSETECLICGIEREELEKIYQNAKDAFKKHTYHCHQIRNYINYLFYIQALEERDPIIEDGVWNYHLENNNAFLPKNVCFQLKERKMLEALKSKNVKDEDEEDIDN